MILPFSTQINGKPTYFVEKIHSGLLQNNLFHEEFELDYDDFQFDINKLAESQPKIHTIREDKNNRWKAGTKIDFFINCRQTNMFRFAPVLPVVSVQKIEIVYYTNREVIMNNLSPKKAVLIDDKIRLNDKQIEELAQNDGFDTIEDFFEYFNQDFTGKIIHWTDKQY